MRLASTAAAGVALAGLAGAAGAAGWAPGWSVLAACGVGAAGIGLHAALGAADPGLEVYGPAIRRSGGGRPEVALTFDDGPDPESTPALLDALAEAGARATFFLLVDRAERRPDLARALAANHEVALHGASHHPWLTVRHPDVGARELVDARDRLAALVGSPVRWFRPPFGATSPRLAESARRAGLPVVWCSVRTRDGGRLTEADVRARCRTASAGDIVLLHEGRPSTARALPGVLSDLRERGLNAVSVGELCASG